MNEWICPLTYNGKCHSTTFWNASFFIRSRSDMHCRPQRRAIGLHGIASTAVTSRSSEGHGCRHHWLGYHLSPSYDCHNQSSVGSTDERRRSSAIYVDINSRSHRVASIDLSIAGKNRERRIETERYWISTSARPSYRVVELCSTVGRCRIVALFRTDQQYYKVLTQVLHRLF